MKRTSRHHDLKNDTSKLNPSWKNLAFVVICFFMLITPLKAFSQNMYSPWVVYYGSSLEMAQFAEFELIILDSQTRLPVITLKKIGKVILGYISLGEIGRHRPYFEQAKQEGILLDENPFWKDSYFVDIRSDYWRKKVINELIPEILDYGFSGVFLDTLDDAQFLEKRDPEKYRGMTDAAIRLVRVIRDRYPYIKIMLNRAYYMLDDVAKYVDMILGESVYADYDFHAKTYRLVKKKIYQRQISLLNQAKSVNPRIGIYTLDYCDPDDTAQIKRIYAIQRQNGFLPYVATVHLDRIIKEP